MKRKKVIAGNWKLHKSNSEAQQLANQIKIRSTDIKNADIILCPPYTALTVVHDVIKDSEIGLGAQNMYWEKSGAFTGEINAEMIKSTGAGYVIIGHSERRQYFGETDETVNKKIKAALDEGLKPIVCVGESLEERESDITAKIIETQVNGALSGLTAQQMADLIIAYEPVWAIGTGKTATPEQAQEVHAQIRALVDSQFGNDVSSNIRIQYGGSVKEENAEILLGQPDIDGALVGGACLKAETFLPIIQAAEKL
ncbi:MAG: triose-phosphate isomerase [Calditrichaeota bacterium]|nr:MAG: triose-phosphate isomerase [Calditrichota bacterium]MBL1206763.1 triose-phosphate isomerase [Calditrichota bacterium]NOG46589.1 triose-phosphate isomerase [Calditrichota bacterium]